MRFSFALFLGLFFISNFCWGQTGADIAAPHEPQATTPDFGGDILVESQGLPTSVDKPSAFTSVIRAEDYQDQLTTLPEILSQQTGVFVKSFDGLGKLSTVSIRGSTAQQVSVFVDGIKINTAQGGAVDFSSIPLGSIEKIEVLRGGAASQFGGDAIGGVVNIVTKRASTTKPYLELKAGLGSFWTAETHEAFSKKFGKVGLTLDHSHLSSQGDFSFLSTGVQFEGGPNFGGGEKFTRRHNQFWSEGFLSRLDVAWTPKFDMAWTNDFFYTSRNQPGPEQETTVLFPKNPLQAHENLLRNTTGLRFNFRDLGIKNLSLSVFPSYQLERSHFTDPSPALGAAIDVTYRNQSTGLKTKLIYEKEFRKQRHTWTLLSDLRYQNFQDASPLDTHPLSGNHDRWIHGLFLQDEISLWNEKLYFNPSLRWEYASDFGNDVAMHFGAVLKPLPWLRLKGNIENSFRYPSFDELYFPDQGFFRGNPDLQKESSLNFDAGLGIERGWATAELNYFFQPIDNSIVFVPVSAFTIAPINTGPVTAQGLEFNFELKPYDFFKLRGNYTFLHARLNGSSKQLPGRPQHLANLQADFDWKHGGVFGRLQYIDKLPIDFTNTKFIRNRALVDVGGTVKWKQHYFATAEIKNLGNVQSLDSVGYPLPRRSYYLSFGYRY